MIPTHNKIIVRVNQSQKDAVIIGEMSFKTANLFESNYRIKSPTIAQVVEGNNIVKAGQIILCHHNLIFKTSPHFIGDDLFSLPFNNTLFATVQANGEIEPICGNIIVKKIEIPTFLPVPDDQIKHYINRYEVVNKGDTKYSPGAIVLTRPHAGYDIIYNTNGIQKSITKVNSAMICGFVTKFPNLVQTI